MKLHMPVLVARNDEAVKKARHAEASVLISRGGTARDLHRHTDKIVVDINIAFAAIFPSIEKLSRRGCRHIAIISNNHLIDRDSVELKIKDISIGIFSYHDDAEIAVLLEQFAQNHVDGIIGDIVPLNMARERYHMTNCLYIESNEISIENAISEALAIVKAQNKKQLRLQTLQSIIDNIGEGIIVYNAAKEIIFSNKTGQQIIASNSVLAGKCGLSKLANYLDSYNGKVLDVSGEKMLLDVIRLNFGSEANSDVLIFQRVNTIEKTARKIQLALYQKGLYAKKHFSDIIYSAPVMKNVLDTAKQFAKSNSTILIYGETGTGKEGLAQSIHNASFRSDKPFVSVNCASLPPTLIESELFGYVEGAFTGARRSGKKGLFELAHTGTIFLDEIGDLPLDIQSRLLRVLQEREIMRIGDDKIMPIDIRLICATNKNLKQLVKEGKFREDLYYRINVLRLTLPPLRERRGDITLLLDFYLNQFAKDSKKIKLSEPIRKYLTNYPWHGNVRELKNIAEVLAFIYKDDLSLSEVKRILDDDEPDMQAGSAENTLTIPVKGTLKDMEKEIIRQMTQKDFTADEICHQLGISKVTLWRKSKQYKKKRLHFINERTDRFFLFAVIYLMGEAQDRYC